MMLTVIDTSQDGIHTVRDYPFTKDVPMNSTGGINTRHRRSTKAQRQAIGEANAPAVVDTKKALLHPSLNPVLLLLPAKAQSLDVDCEALYQSMTVRSGGMFGDEYGAEAKPAERPLVFTEAEKKLIAEFDKVLAEAVANLDKPTRQHTEPDSATIRPDSVIRNDELLINPYFRNGYLVYQYRIIEGGDLHQKQIEKATVIHLIKSRAIVIHGPRPEWANVEPEDKPISIVKPPEEPLITELHLMRSIMDLSPSEVLAEAAFSRANVADIDAVVADLTRAINHPGNLEARTGLRLGVLVEVSPLQWVARHRALGDRFKIVIASRLTERDPLVAVFKRAEIRDMLIRVRDANDKKQADRKAVLSKSDPEPTAPVSLAA